MWSIRNSPNIIRILCWIVTSFCVSRQLTIWELSTSRMSDRITAHHDSRQQQQRWRRKSTKPISCVICDQFVGHHYWWMLLKHEMTEWRKKNSQSTNGWLQLHLSKSLDYTVFINLKKVQFSTTVFWPFNIIELSLIRQVPMPKTFKKVHLRSAADVV